MKDKFKLFIYNEEDDFAEWVSENRMSESAVELDAVTWLGMYPEDIVMLVNVDEL